MRREKFYFNTQTLRYEKVEVTWKERLLHVFGFLCAAVVAGFLFTLLVWRVFPSPRRSHKT